jgi:hypothetical protein
VTSLAAQIPGRGRLVGEIPHPRPARLETAPRVPAIAEVVGDVVLDDKRISVQTVVIRPSWIIATRLNANA